ncbi:MAG: Eco57I restriction-modification methylase domain-containing protein [Deltaproteobacteria bacterium]|jgi:hypothetical protein|nr:Eco57I restriction-modification methylase domain-containing protein [Deltaproteobacteria bacterium]
MANIFNNLFDRAFLATKGASCWSPLTNAQDKFNFCQALFNNNMEMDNFNGKTLNNQIIFPLVQALGWFYVQPEDADITDPDSGADLRLFADKTAYLNFLTLNKNTRQTVVSESWPLLAIQPATLELDNHQTSIITNPYWRLRERLRQSKQAWGFLTNGRQWLLANNPASLDKKYLAFSLDKILATGDLADFELFWNLLSAINFQPTPNGQPKIELVRQKDQQFQQDNFSRLWSAITGFDDQFSLFEDIGRHLFVANDRRSDPTNLNLVFEQSLIFFLRLTLLTHFEGKTLASPDKTTLDKTTLDNPGLDKPPIEPKVTLKSIRHSVKPTSNQYQGWLKLRSLFAAVADGKWAMAQFPLESDLFDPQKAPLLSQGEVFSDAALARVFNSLFNAAPDLENAGINQALFSPAQLGTIYEGLLGFEFRVARTELFYASSHKRRPSMEGYFEKQQLQTQKNLLSVKRQYKKGDLYLVNFHNHRKISGSYYTPDALAWPLVTQGVVSQLAGPFQNHSLADLKILDCACGCGQLLTVALGVLAYQGLKRLDADADPKLKSLSRQEMDAIKANRRKLGLYSDPMSLDEVAVLKRVFLKRSVYGVDRSPFAVELTKWALWSDSFIYGAPAPFLAGRVKCGDSLMGSDLASLAPTATKAPLESGLLQRLRQLSEEIAALSALPTSPDNDIINIKDRYYNKILPKINELNYYVNFNNYLDILKVKKIYPLPPIFAKLNDRQLGQAITATEKNDLARLADETEQTRRIYGFFNWKIEFAEVFSPLNLFGPGFNLIVGNPPWDKTKFEEPLFFVQYHPNYRTSPNSQKKAIATDLLAQPDIRAKYDQEKRRAELYNEYLTKKFPLSQGNGDNNLFRFFMEKAWNLLAPGGSLSYILPLSFLTDDGSTRLRKNILEKGRLVRFDGFENKKRIFPHVHPRYKFGLAQIENTPDPDQVAQVRFMLTDPRILAKEEGRFPYSLSDVKGSSPKNWAYLETDGGHDLSTLKKLYSKFPSLDPGWLDFRNELHATNDKNIFHETRRAHFLPLYKGEMIWHYQALAVEPKYWLDPEELDEYSLNSLIFRLINDLKAQFASDMSLKKVFNGGFNWSKILNYLGISQKEGPKPLLVPERRFPRLAIRAIASDTNERTLISALVPRNIGAQNSLWLSIAGHYALDLEKRTVDFQIISLARPLFVQAILNSLTLDWILRASVTINVNKTHIFRLPIPQPTDQELAANPVYVDLIRDSAAISLYYHPELGQDLAPFVNAEGREALDSTVALENRLANLELKVARLYDLTSEEMNNILANFKVLKSKKPTYLENIRKRL